MDSDERLFFYLIFLLWLPLVAADNGGRFGRFFPGGTVSIDSGINWVLDKIDPDMWHGVEVFGPNKTFMAYVTGPLLFFLTVQTELWAFGINDWALDVSLIVGVCVVLGDHIKSLIKRRILDENGIKKYPPGASWEPWDQIDYAIGGCVGYTLVAMLVDVSVSIKPLWGWVLLWLILVVWAYITKLSGNYLLHCIHLRATPH